jgi:dTDP-4-dehydrorhamnose 3,5-epimerase
MKFEPLELPGATLVKLERHTDARGFFARSMCSEEFRAHGLPAEFAQSSISCSHRRGTVRGMHWQWPPAQEGKLVRCLRGAIHDVLIDLRPEQPSYLRHCAVILDEDNRDAVFIPPGVAHGFQTLRDESEVLYQMTVAHAPQLSAGLRWNDPTFAIRWPIEDPVVIAERDAVYPDFDPREFAAELARRTASGQAVHGR